MRNRRAACGFVVTAGIMLGLAPGARAAAHAAFPQRATKAAYELEELRVQMDQLRPSANKQSRKLDLELTKLKQETSLEGRLRPFVPLIGIVGALWAVWRYVGDRRLQRRLLIEQSIGTNLSAVT